MCCVGWNCENPWAKFNITYGGSLSMYLSLSGCERERERESIPIPTHKYTLNSRGYKTKSLSLSLHPRAEQQYGWKVTLEVQLYPAHLFFFFFYLISIFMKKRKNIKISQILRYLLNRYTLFQLIIWLISYQSDSFIKLIYNLRAIKLEIKK